ncbi:hypothetical protein [Candidatus Tisiphia endosymbiont of Parasteatoda lunata]
MSYKLDKYEQDIEINFEEQPSIKNQNDIKLFQNAAKEKASYYYKSS